MPTLDEVRYAKVTITDVKLAAAYYPILLDLAKHKHCLTYGELVLRAKEENTQNETVQKAIAVSTGRRLDVVRIFTEERNLPDLTSLIISKSSGECGYGFTVAFDPVQAREKVFEWDWSLVSSEFDLFLNKSKTIIARPKKITFSVAKDMVWKHYLENKASLPPDIRVHHDLIVEAILDGLSVADAFDRALDMD